MFECCQCFEIVTFVITSGYSMTSQRKVATTSSFKTAHIGWNWLIAVLKIKIWIISDIWKKKEGHHYSQVTVMHIYLFSQKSPEPIRQSLDRWEASWPDRQQSLFYFNALLVFIFFLLISLILQSVKLCFIASLQNGLQTAHDTKKKHTMKLKRIGWKVMMPYDVMQKV